MNSAEYVAQEIQKLKTSGIPLSEAAWKAAKLCVGWPYIFGDRGEYCTVAHRKAKATKYPVVATKCQVLHSGADSCSGCKWLPKGKKVRAFDCRGFTYYILLQIYGWKLMGVGCTAQWNDAANWKAKGKVSDGIPRDTIVCLYYSKENKEKTWEHTGFYYNGETVECSAGVQYSKTLHKKWTHWGVPACVEGDVPTPTPPPAPDPGTDKPILKRGSKGEYVYALQTALINRGYDLGSYGVDGDFGKATEAAVKKFQKDNGLTADGVVGPKTWAALEAPAPEVQYTVTIPHVSQKQAEELCQAWSGATMKKE